MDKLVGLKFTMCTLLCFSVQLLGAQQNTHHCSQFRTTTDDSTRQCASNFRREWNHFLQRFSSAPQNLKALDEPVLSLQRNVFCSKREEQGVKDHKVLELLYEEAKYNMLTSRYPCEISDYIMLGGIQVDHKSQWNGILIISLRVAGEAGDWTLRHGGSHTSILPTESCQFLSTLAFLIFAFQLSVPVSAGARSSQDRQHFVLAALVRQCQNQPRGRCHPHCFILLAPQNVAQSRGAFRGFHPSHPLTAFKHLSLSIQKH